MSEKEGKILEKGTILNVTQGNAQKFLDEYSGLFAKNADGKLVITKDDTVEKDGNDYYYYDDEGRRHLIDEINKQSRKVVKNKEKDGEEEYDYDADDDEDEEIEDEIEEKSDGKNQGYTKFDGKTFYIYPKPRTRPKAQDIRKYRSQNNIRNGVRNTGNRFKDNNNLQRFDDNNLSNNNNDPMNKRMLGDKFDAFVNAVNESKALSIEQGKVKNTSEFKYKYLNKIDNCKLLFYETLQHAQNEHWNISFFSDDKYIKAQSGDVDLTPMYLNKSKDRARLINNIDSVIEHLSDNCIKNRTITFNPGRKIKPLSIPACIRYVSYAALGDVLQECAKMTYNDIGTDKAEQTLDKVEGLMKALSLSNDELTFEDGSKHGGNKKKAFLEALNIWKQRYEQMKSKLTNNELEEYVVNNERPGMNLDTNNRNRGRNENCGPFTSI